MDDVDFVLGQYDEGKGVSKKGLIFYSNYRRSNTFLSPCQTANNIRDLRLDIVSTTFLGRERSKMLRCVLFCSGQTRCRMILLGSEESKQPVSVNENISGSQLKTGRSSVRPVERTHLKFPTKSTAFQVSYKTKNATFIVIRKVKHITQQQIQHFIRQMLSRCWGQWQMAGFEGVVAQGRGH